MANSSIAQNRDASVVVDRQQAPVRLAALRAELVARHLDGWLVPLSDEHHNEYVPLRAQRLAWLTGFTGSAGMAIVLLRSAAIFVDGRYTLQVRDQVDAALFEPHHSTDSPPSKWLAANNPVGRVGYDPWLHTVDEVDRMAQAVRPAGGELVAEARNAIDAVWPEQPPAPLTPVVPHPEEFSGEAAAQKRARIGQGLAEAKLAAALISAPDSIAWLLNIRGDDVPHTPLPLSFCLLRPDGTAELFVDRRKLSPETEAHLGAAVTVREPDALGPALDALGQAKARVLCDPATGAAWLFERLTRAGAEIVRGSDPCQLPKARKNPVELDGTRAAHRRDGAALSSFLGWLAREAPSGRVDELAAGDKLLQFRAKGNHFRDLSFDSITGSGPNGAIVHYRATPATNRRLAPGELFLLDSGAQYLDGTTDVTRTIAIGEPTAEMRERFTRVLKGHIALATARFPAGTTGSQLDALARHALWQVGLDYDHGTGHGVGSYLGVHEGPQRISKLPNTVALEPGMIVSNEPGYYKTGTYGIRIENLVVVREIEQPAGAERKLLGFETLTRAPIDRALVDGGLLTAAETAWLDDYHAAVRAELTPLVDAETADWLAQATRPLAEGGKMKFGVFYEHQLPKPWGPDDEHRIYREALDQVELADRLGIDYAWEVEHHFLEEYSHSSAPEVFLAACSQRTRRIRLGHGIVLMSPQYNHPARVAERIAALDLVSDGRVEFGTGESASAAEMGGFGVRLDLKREQWLEGLEACVNMMVMNPYPGHAGRFFQMPCRNVVPKPLQRPHPPLWVACSNRETIKLAARLGIGALTFAFIDPAEAKLWVDEYYHLFKTECIPIGHAVNPNVCMMTGLSVHADAEEAKRRGMDGFRFFTFALAHHYVLGGHKPGRTDIWKKFEQVRDGLAEVGASRGIGTPKEVSEHLRAFAATGVDQVGFIQQGGRNRHDHICETLELFAREVMPEFHDAEPARLARKQQELAPYIELAMQRKAKLRELTDDEIPTIAALGRTVAQVTPVHAGDQARQEQWRKVVEVVKAKSAAE